MTAWKLLRIDVLDSGLKFFFQTVIFAQCIYIIIFVEKRKK